MTVPIERRAAPSLFGTRTAAADGPHAHSLLDLMYDGFHVLFMLRNGSAPPAGEVEFMDKVSAFLHEFEDEARKLRAHSEDIDAAKYAFCAALDEAILGSSFAIRAAWERRPLQLTVFGDQLAGEHFFDRLESLRSKGGIRLQALQVFHLCLLLGFKGKYALDDSDRLAYLTARLGDEIAHIKGQSKGFAPRALRPDQIVHKLRSNTPFWMLGAVFTLTALLVYLGLESSLHRSAEGMLAAYSHLVRLPARPASLTVTLP
jgi:type VI secretion system protein ImpK